MEFRKLNNCKKEISFSECEEILLNEKRGVLSVIGDGGYPYCMPMNHFYQKEEGVIYFHCGKEGHRIDAINANDKACFCVFDKGVKDVNGWAKNFKSVIVFGKIEVVKDLKQIEDITTKLSYKFTDDFEYIKKEIEGALSRTILLKLLPESITGKRVKEA